MFRRSFLAILGVLPLGLALPAWAKLPTKDDGDKFSELLKLGLVRQHIEGLIQAKARYRGFLIEIDGKTQAILVTNGKEGHFGLGFALFPLKNDYRQSIGPCLEYLAELTEKKWIDWDSIRAAIARQED